MDLKVLCQYVKLNNLDEVQLNDNGEPRFLTYRNFSNIYFINDLDRRKAGRHNYGRQNTATKLAKRNMAIIKSYLFKFTKFETRYFLNEGKLIVGPDMAFLPVAQEDEDYDVRDYLMTLNDEQLARFQSRTANREGCDVAGARCNIS